MTRLFNVSVTVSSICLNCTPDVAGDEGSGGKYALSTKFTVFPSIKNKLIYVLYMT